LLEVRTNEALTRTFNIKSAIKETYE
jgi:hypothetical protein